jgi:hypothetical protein
MGGVLSVTPRPRFTPGNGPKLVWTQRLEEKAFAFAWDRKPVFQSVVRHYTA